MEILISNLLFLLSLPFFNLYYLISIFMLFKDLDFMNIIYQEQQKTHFILIVIFIIVAVFLLTLVLFPQFLGKSEMSEGVKIILMIITVVDLILFWSFSQLTIKLSNEHLQISFGIFKKKFSFSEIKDVLVQDYQKSIYFGYGIRFGRDRSIGYIARGGRGIRLKMDRRDYFFSTNNPEQLRNLIKERIKF